MKIETLYRRAIEAGVANDPRGPEAVARLLEEEKVRAEKMSDDERAAWDPDRLFNPYADSRLLAGDPDAEARRIMVGIDMDVSEVLLAHTLNRDRAAAIDLVVAHHPQGIALAGLADVMHVQSDMLASYGVTVSVAEQLLEKRIGEVERRLRPGNHGRAVDAARLLGLPMMCLHTPADNCVNTYLDRLFAREKPERLKNLLDLLRTVPEYRAAVGRLTGPKIVHGAETGRCGRISVEMTGGTEGARTIYESYAAAGVSTIVSMHISEEALENAKKAHLNIVLAGHISSDTLGLNLLFDEIEKGGGLEFVGVSGFARTRAAER